MSKILVVDDEEKIRQVVRIMLEGEGHEVIEAHDGKKCLEILENEKPDLIIMDVMMPEMDGWETVGKIKEDESNKDIRISMLTVKSRESDVTKSLVEVDADWHMSKPVTKDELLRTVKSLLPDN